MTAKKPAKKKPARQSKADLEQQIGELTADLQRLQAEFENFRRRTEEERFRIMQIGKEAMVTSLLPIIDNLDRALSHVPTDLKGHKYVAGIKAVSKQVDEYLSKNEITRIKTKGEHYDADLMEAVAVEGDGHKEMVSEEIQPGYKMGDIVIRHAMVKVKRSK